MSLGFALLYIALAQGQRLNWMHSATIIALIVTGLFLLLASVVRHLTLQHRLVNLKFLMRRNIAVARVVAVVFFEFEILATVFLLPNYLGSVQGYLPLQTGPVMLWAGLPQCIFGLLAMYLLRYIDAQLILTAGKLHPDSDRLPDECAAFPQHGQAPASCLRRRSCPLVWRSASTALVGAIILGLVNGGAFSHPIDSLTFGAVNSLPDGAPLRRSR